MTATTAAKAIREHLLKFWDGAEAWARGWCEDDWPHPSCLVTLKKGLHGYYDDFLPMDDSLLDLLTSDGKDAVLAYLDTLILGGVK